MTKEIYERHIDPQLFDLLFCPTCKLKLKPNKLLDMFAQGFICKNNHRFFITLSEPLIQQAIKCRSLPSLQNNNNKEVIKQWLTNFNYRSTLNGQLATIFRRIYEILVGDLHISHAESYDIFKYCLLCVNKLEIFQQNDCWVQGLKCSNHHEFRQRIGIGFSFRGEYLHLEEEMSDKSLLELIGFWLKEDASPDLKNALHDQIKSILINFLKQ